MKIQYDQPVIWLRMLNAVPEISGEFQGRLYLTKKLIQIGIRPVLHNDCLFYALQDSLTWSGAVDQLQQAGDDIPHLIGLMHVGFNARLQILDCRDVLGAAGVRRKPFLRLSNESRRSGECVCPAFPARVWSLRMQPIWRCRKQNPAEVYLIEELFGEKQYASYKVALKTVLQDFLVNVRNVDIGPFRVNIVGQARHINAFVCDGVQISSDGNQFADRRFIVGIA